MKAQDNIKDKFDRNVKVLSLRPSLGHGTGVSVTRITNGLSCEILEGDWKLQSDMPVQVGGNANAPSPGVLGRAALGSCLATGYMLWASKLEIPIENLEIHIEADYDDGALFDCSDTFPGYSEVRYTVKIKSSKSLLEIEEFINKAERHSPYLDVFSRAQSCKRNIELIKTQIDES